MTTQALPTDRIVRVNASITPTAPLRPDFGRSLLITTDGALRPPNLRTRTFSDVRGIAEFFGTRSTVYDKALEYFGQTPYPKDLIVGRWAEVAANAQIFGGRHASLAALQAVTAGVITMSGQDTAAINLSSATNFADVASTIQASLRAIANPTAWASATAYTTGDEASGSNGLIYAAVQDNTDIDPVGDDGTYWRSLGPQVDQIAVVYDIEGIFVLTNDSDDLMMFPTGDLAASLGLTEAGGADSFEGHDADASIGAAFADMVRLDGTFYWVGHDTTVSDYALDGVLEQLADAVQASGRYQLDLNSYGSAPLATGDETSFDARIGAKGQNRVNRNWNGSAGESIGVGIAAVMSTVNFDGVRTLINPHGRPLRGFTPGRLTVDQANELERKRVNYFATIGPQSIYTPGTTGADGVWRDSQYFLDWLQERVQLDVYNYIVNNPERNPQTAEGLQGVLAVIRAACRQGVRNGGIAPGFVSETLRGTIRRVTGVTGFDGFLEKGFLVFAPSFATLSDAALRARRAPSPRVWIRGSGAINNIEIDMIYDG